MKTILALSLAVLALSPLALCAGEAKPLTISGVTFKPGESWTSKKPASSMRAAELEIVPADGADPLTAVVYYFGAGQGGSAEANLSRWVGQFESSPEKETKEHDCGGKTVQILHARGTYMESAGGPFGPKTPREGYAMLAAVIPGQDANIFIKLTGPEKDVAAIEEKFVALATSPFAK